MKDNDKLTLVFAPPDDAKDEDKADGSLTSIKENIPNDYEYEEVPDGESIQIK